MDMNSLGIAGVAAITVICYLVGMIFKLSPWDNDRVIPVACGVSGCIIGLLWFYFGWVGFPAEDPITASAVGIVSGLAATGINQIFKQINH